MAAKIPDVAENAALGEVILSHRVDYAVQR